MSHNLKPKSLPKILALILVLFFQLSCISTKTYKNALLKNDSTKRALDEEIKRNYMLTLELLKTQGLYLQHLRHDSLVTKNSAERNYVDKSTPSVPNPPL